MQRFACRKYYLILYALIGTVQVSTFFNWALNLYFESFIRFFGKKLNLNTKSLQHLADSLFIRYEMNQKQQTWKMSES